ncbi:hypothetical protein LXL04_012850 [Taraxacum kok-saghyz]
MGSAGMKRKTRVSGDKVLRSGRRLFASRYEEAVKRMRLTSVTVVDTLEDKFEIRKQKRETKLGESKISYRHVTDDVMAIDHEELRGSKEKGEIELGESKKPNLVYDNHDEGDNVIRTKKFGIVYSRKRKRIVPCDSIVKCSNLELQRGCDKMYRNKYFKKRVRTYLGSVISNSNLDFNGKDVLRKGSVILFGPCSYKIRGNIYGFSSFVTSVLRYMKKVKVFSWRHFSSFLLSDLTASIYSSIGIRFSQDSNYTMGHGFLKVFGPVFSLLLFTVDFISLPFTFLYIHSSSLLKFAFLSYALILHPVVESSIDDDIKNPSISTRQFVISTKPRSSRKRVPRVSLFKKLETDINSIVPIPGVREISGYEDDKFVPFRLPESYICSKSDEVSRTLQKSYPIYDMDSGDEEWLKNFNNDRFLGSECVSEDTFEKVIDAFERGNYCSPDDYSDATSAIGRCLGLASKEVLEALYKYWITKRKKRRSPLVRVFQCYRRTRVRKHFTKTIPRKKRSLRGRKSQYRTGKQIDFIKAMMNEKRSLEEAAKIYMKVHKTQEDVKRSEAAAIVKRQEAQALMEAADLATYRATMTLRIAEARAATAGFIAKPNKTRRYGWEKASGMPPGRVYRWRSGRYGEVQRQSLPAANSIGMHKPLFTSAKLYLPLRIKSLPAANSPKSENILRVAYVAQFASTNFTYHTDRNLKTPKLQNLTMLCCTFTKKNCHNLWNVKMGSFPFIPLANAVLPPVLVPKECQGLNIIRSATCVLESPVKDSIIPKVPKTP